MPTSPIVFRESYNRCDWIFDFFAYGFDFLNGRFFPSAEPTLEESWENALKDVKGHGIETQIVNADGAVPDVLRCYIDLPGNDVEMENPEFCMRLFTVLWTIDQ